VTNDVLAVLRQLACAMAAMAYLARGKYPLAMVWIVLFFVWMVDAARDWGRWR